MTWTKGSFIILNVSNEPIVCKEISMEGYIDIHSHILPGFDDGSRSIEQTMSMAEIAQMEGIRVIIATPHFKLGRIMPSPLEIEKCLNQIQDKLDSQGSQIRLLPGSEIYYSHDIASLLSEKKILTLAFSRYVLVEFSPFVEYRYIKSALQDLLLEGYLPIIAHIERYHNLWKDYEIIQEIVNMGAYVQVNAPSILGDLGKKHKKRCKHLLKDKLVHFIATDSHNPDNRAPILKKCMAYIEKKYDIEYINQIFVENPNKILNDEFI